MAFFFFFFLERFLEIDTGTSRVNTLLVQLMEDD